MNEMISIPTPEKHTTKPIWEDPDSLEFAIWHHDNVAKEEQTEEFKEYLKMVAEGTVQAPSDVAVTALARLRINELRERRAKTGV
jgi:hypothetical protein